MARVGNEARLILKLAKERVNEQEIVYVSNTARSGEEKKGYSNAIHDYNYVLIDILVELER